jgi:hypothetical protein
MQMLLYLIVILMMPKETPEKTSSRECRSLRLSKEHFILTEKHAEYEPPTKMAPTTVFLR